MVNNLESRIIPVEQDEPEDSYRRLLNQPYSSLQGKSQVATYLKFENRLTAKSLESRVDHYVKKRRLDSEVYDKIAEASSLAQTYFANKQNETKE